MFCTFCSDKNFNTLICMYPPMKFCSMLEKIAVGRNGGKIKLRKVEVYIQLSLIGFFIQRWLP